MKIYKIRTNAYDAFVAVDEEGKVVSYSTAEFVYNISPADVEDWTSWEDDCAGMDFADFLGSMMHSADIIGVAEI